MELTSRSQYVDIVQHQYFGGMERAQPERILPLLEITPRSPDSTIGVRKLRNCNFFQFEAGLIAAVTAYFAIPPADIDPWPGRRDAIP